MSRHFRYCLLVLAVASSTACATRKSAVPTALPIPLAAALMDDPYSDYSLDRNFAVGRVPEGFPPSLVPGGPARIVGGMKSGDQIVAIFADSTRRLAAVFEQLFVDAGYARPPARTGSGFMGGSGPRSYFCRDNTMVTAQPLAGANRHLAKVTWTPAQRFSECFHDVSDVKPEVLLTMPELIPPPGVRIPSAGGGNGGEGINSRAEMMGPSIVPANILSHYARQLIAAGWSGASPAVSDRVASQFFEAKDSSGASWEGVLTVAGGGDRASLTLVMRKPRKS